MLLLWPPPQSHLCIFNVCFCSSIFLVACYILWSCLERKSTANDPPGNRGLPVIGETIHFMSAINSSRGFYDFVRVRRIRDGNCFKTNIFGKTHMFMSSIESAKSVLNNESANFTKRYMKSIAQLIGSQSLLCASHHHHKLIRDRLTNLFSTNSISLFIKQFDELVITTLKAWGNEGPVIILDQALEITFKAMCKTLLSLENGDDLHTLKEDIASICKAMLALPINLPWTRFYKGVKARKRVMATLKKIISERRNSRSTNDHQDFLEQLIRNTDDKACDGGSQRLTDTEIQDNILTMIIAGQDTTASAMAWMVKYLGENETTYNLLRDEQIQVAKQNSNNRFLSRNDINNMPYASKVVKESLRLASIVPWFPRLALEDCNIQGFKVKRGWNVNIDAKSIHLDPTLYSDPYKFDPSRFDDEPKSYRFLAFGMGARSCLGTNMARAMMLIFLHRLVTTYKWTVISSDTSVEKWALFARLRSGCPVYVTRVTC